MTKELKKFLNRYSGVCQYKPKKVSKKSVYEICNTVKLAKGLTVEKLIRDIRVDMGFI